MRLKQLVALLVGTGAALALAGCDLLGGDDAAVDPLVGSWSIAEVNIQAGGEERDVTDDVLEDVEESRLTFREDGSYALRVEDAEGTVEKEGSYTLNAEAGEVEFTPADASSSGAFSYEMNETEDRLTLAADDVAAMADLFGIEMDGFAGGAALIQRAEVVLERTEQG